MSSVYSDIGLSTTESRQTAVQQAAKTGSSKISQEDFLKMLTTELCYQDPTNPSDNNQMVAQLSQLSMVDGINSLNSTVTDLQGSVASGESLMASSLVGQNVLLQTPIAYNNGTGIAGEITTGDTGASDITVMVTASSGQVVYQQSVEGSYAGDVPFAWDGTDNNGTQCPAGNYTVSAVGMVNGESQSIPTNTYGRVSSVVLGNGTEETRLNILGRDDTIGLADILQVAGG